MLILLLLQELLVYYYVKFGNGMKDQKLIETLLLDMEEDSKVLIFSEMEIKIQKEVSHSILQAGKRKM